MDPARRDGVEERLDAFQSIARKHRITPDQLPDLVDTLRGEFDELSHAEERGAELEKEVATAKDDYLALAGRLSSGRRKAAQAFSSAVTEAMSSLGMPGGVFDAHISRISEDDARSWGLDHIEFLISANPGQAPMPLSKVASGGELSRMSLSIQVIASDGSAIPTMVFDEVKVTDGKATRTGVHVLSHDERIEELARMLGGVDITQKTLDHAAEMLAGAGEKRAS